MRLLRAHGSVKLRKVASDSAMQGLWLGDRKVGSQVISEDRSQLPLRGGRRASDRIKKRAHRFGLDLSKREEQVACHASALALAMTDKVHREAKM